MKTKIIVLVMIFAGIGFSQDNYHKRDKQKHDDLELREIVMMISANFEKLEREYLTKLSYRDYTRAKSILIDSYELLNLIPVSEENYDEQPLPISERDFQGLIESVKNEGFDSDKLSIISIASDYHYFLVDQVVELMKLFIMSDSKMEVVKTTYSNVIDKQNSHRIISSFSFSSDKEEAKKIINSYPIK